MLLTGRKDAYEADCEKIHIFSKPERSLVHYPL
jgi:hypothetical protein